MPEPGVTRRLAGTRVHVLAEVACDLALDLPAGADAPANGPINGRVALRFLLREAADPLVIDFRPGLAGVSSITANGHTSRATGVNGHILVPSGELTAGENVVEIAFRAGDGLHCAAGLVYSLFVPAGAHHVFPCFDQPDIKARFTLSLTLPRDWQAVSNAAEIERVETGDRARVQFAPTLPLSTYVFAFAAGDLRIDAARCGGRSLRVFHRPDASSALDRNREAIVGLHASAVDWLEEYTGLPYPFDKLDVVLVPSFEFRGMEHAGAIFYDAGTLLLEETATEDQILTRAQLIAHETAHMWFGDLVTMRWFDDVWLKEVFANLLAARIAASALAHANHDLRFFVVHYPAAYAVERTAGTHAIRQPLDNLDEAKDLYGAIVYHKAPIVMRALERTLGPDVLRDGLRRHLRARAFGNAAWEDLMADVESAPGAHDLTPWSRQWIESAGRPTTALEVDGTVDVAGLEAALAAGGQPAYERLMLDERTRAALLDHLPLFTDPLARAAGWLVLWEEMLDERLRAADLVTAILRAVPMEPVEQIVHLVLGWLREAFWRFLRPAEQREIAAPLEEVLLAGASTGDTMSRRSTCFAALGALATTAETIARLERIWRRQETIDGLILSEPDETALAAELALREVPEASAILEEQRDRLTTEDRRERFAFVVPALSPAGAVRSAFFESLENPERRRREAWVVEAVAYVHHPLRAESAEALLPLALDLLAPVRDSGDIFFARGWITAALSGHRSPTAAVLVHRFLADRPDYPVPLRRLVLQAADNLFRSARAIPSTKMRA